MIWLLVCWCLVAAFLAIGLGRSLRLTRVDAESLREGPCGPPRPFESRPRGD